ncbi:sigma-70 family RNA polymerase sigma factor [Lactobacillus sp. ESL0791]|uniref:sigma-70 family RNA polymerase sigma factor n=1 Tax=Lactobacillus sp. ESL0791 TaxID=2983234 RepID=UPI0023F7E2DE|nr:sigma-70 family RNA polymerase sigma factor [Lactobacillus sp. ESL0791]MDF7638358.1 sigma-70 family RNA polymerase sigma factor [Lactobacillus sp. ESL0791]
MAKLKMNPKRELTLIKRIRQNDDQALPELCFYYQPLINNVKKSYFVRDYDDQDWDQEAMIVCHQAAIDYSPDKGHFGSYFKRRLNNHATSLLRRDLAYRRRASKEAISWEAFLTTEDACSFMPQINYFLSIPASESYTEFLDSLSNLEMKALLVILGEVSLEEVEIDRLTLIRARSRVMQKLRKVLLN